MKKKKRRHFIYPFYQSQVGLAIVRCIHWYAIGMAMVYWGLSKIPFLEIWACEHAEKHIRIMWESMREEDDDQYR